MTTAVSLSRWEDLSLSAIFKKTQFSIKLYHLKMAQLKSDANFF